MKVSIVGFGNVGYHLSKSFLESGVEIHSIFNRSDIALPDLLESHNIPFLHELKQLPDSSDLVLLCISDDHIKEVSHQLPDTIKRSAIIAHTSGIYGPDILADEIQQKAAFYPLNSFSKEASVDWSRTPIFISVSGTKAEPLEKLARKISKQIYRVNAEQKAVLHMAAVFVNNFPNALFSMASQMLEDHELELKPLIPLMETTIEKIKMMSPEAAQTGPALRNDRRTLKKHIELLKAYPFEKQLYQLISHYINPKLPLPDEDDRDL